MAADSEARGDSGYRAHVFSSSEELIQKLHKKWDPVKDHHQHAAMYSSIFDGIVVDPALMIRGAIAPSGPTLDPPLLMMIPMDDHMVHRGHGVFDTAIIFDGYIYELDDHLDRLLQSASLAKIPPPFPRATLKSILIQLTSVSRCEKGTLRYWLSAGPGNFLLSPSGCRTPAFYGVVINEDFSQHKQGVEVITSTIPMKSPLFCRMKNVNYLPNVLAQMEAEEKGAHASIWVDEDGYIAEGPNMNVAFITRDKELILPSFDKILSGCTAKRLLELAARMVETGRLKSVGTVSVKVEEARAAAEMMFLGSTLPILPIVTWDGKPIGDGEVGELTMALSDLLWNDMASGHGKRVRVPYD